LWEGVGGFPKAWTQMLERGRAKRVGTRATCGMAGDPIAAVAQPKGFAQNGALVTVQVGAPVTSVAAPKWPSRWFGDESCAVVPAPSEKA